MKNDKIQLFIYFISFIGSILATVLSYFLLQRF